MPAKLDVTTPSDIEIKVVRRFKAPAQMIFDCHTKPDLVQRWLLGPDGWSMPICEIDLRVGGTYHFHWRSNSGEQEFGTRGEFREIEAPTRLVQTERMDGVDGEMLCRYELIEENGETLFSATMRFPSSQHRDMALQSGMTDGMGVSYDRLATLIGTL